MAAKLYTRTGDDGSTGLFGGQRVGKDDPRVEAYGTVDELNACLGLAAAACAGSGGPGAAFRQRLLAMLAQLQSRLFDLGADLATPHDSKHDGKIARINPAQITEAEQWIDEVDGGNDSMTHFVLPGGTELAARLHLARTVCRRAERLMIALGRIAPINQQAIIYVNRVSDLLFAMARRANKEGGVTDVKWEPGRPS